MNGRSQRAAAFRLLEAPPFGRAMRERNILRRFSVEDAVAWTSSHPEPPQDALKSILNRVEPLKSFVYKEQRLVEVAGGQPFLEVDVEPRAMRRPKALRLPAW